MTTSTLRRLSQGLLLTFGLAPAALAGDWVFISNFDKVRAYDFDSGMTIPNSPLSMPGTITGLERSPGGSSVYALDELGNVCRIDTRTMTPHFSPVPLPLGAKDLAFDRLRWRTNSVDGSMIVRYLEGTHLTPDGWTQHQGGLRHEHVAVTRDGSRSFLFSNGSLYEFDPGASVTGVATHCADVEHDVTEMGISPDGRYMVLAGPNERNGVPLGFSGLQVSVYDLIDNKIGYRGSLVSRSGPSGLAFDKNAPERFFIGSERGVHRFEYMNRNHHLRGAQYLLFGPGAVRDLAWNDDTQLYVLHDVSPFSNLGPGITRYQAGVTFNGHVDMIPRFGDFRLVVVPEPRGTKTLVSLLRPEWVGLLEALDWTGWKLPVGWQTSACELSGGKDDPWVVKAAAMRAASWLADLEFEEGVLEPDEVLQFLSEAACADAAAAGQFLDLIFLGEGMEK